MTPVTLHTHTAEGSPDATWTDAEATRAYGRAGFVSAVTDHDVRTLSDRLVGVERTIDRPTKLHVVEVDGFRFLAHPAIPFPRRTRERAAEYVREHDLDGVEKISRGVQQYTGTIEGVVELANDDAHNAHQLGLSYMAVPDAVAEDGVMDAIRRGDFERRVDFDAVRFSAGRITQGVQMARHRVRQTMGGNHVT